MYVCENIANSLEADSKRFQLKISITVSLQIEFGITFVNTGPKTRVNK